LSHRLAPDILAALRTELARCGPFDTETHTCDDSPSQTLTCETPAGMLEVSESCGYHDDYPLPRYVDGLLRVVNLAAIVADPQACARAHPAADRDQVWLSELVRHALQIEHYRACTVQRK
jgi:hypothetical protein